MSNEKHMFPVVANVQARSQGLLVQPFQPEASGLGVNPSRLNETGPSQ